VTKNKNAGEPYLEVALAGLTLQVYQRGLDRWNPIVVSRNGGHRRHMALLLSYALRDWSAGRKADHPDTEITVDVTRTTVEMLVESLRSLEKVVVSLRNKYTKREITAVLCSITSLPPMSTAAGLSAPAMRPSPNAGRRPSTTPCASSWKAAASTTTCRPTNAAPFPKMWANCGGSWTVSARSL
jgi:hypothetical protein